MNFSYTPLSPPSPKPPISDPTSRAGAGEREHMFEKVVTPSDVGKLNRLVIPKQHAEKYFPLDSAAGEKGLLLNFDEIGDSGKSWRFRYSYWSSSQSYVITKGWSRFVKDKHLDAGDVVSFSRVSADDTHRHFIDWRRRPVSSASRFDQVHHGISLNRPPWCYSAVGTAHGIPPPFLPPYRRPDRHDLIGNYGGGFGANNFGVLNPNYSCVHHHGSVVCFGMGGNCQAGSAAGVGPMVFESVPVVNENAAPKRLRLFGVNMDCVTSADHDLLNQISSPSSSDSLQLRLHGGDPSSSANGMAIKGKSAVSLDFHI